MEQRVIAVFATYAEVIPCDNLLRRHGALAYPFGIVSNVLGGPAVQFVQKAKISAS